MKGNCSRGHKYTSETLYVHVKSGIIQCKVCLRENHKRRMVTTQYSGNRGKALERDGYKCVRCSMTQTEHIEKWGKDITVDHIDGLGSHLPVEQRNDRLDNLQTLCLICHGVKDMPRRKTATGEQCGNVTLTAKQVLEIRKLKRTDANTYTSMGKRYGVSGTTIKNIISGKTWSSL